VGQAVRLIGAGVVVGLGLSAALGHALSSMLYGVGRVTAPRVDDRATAIAARLMRRSRRSLALPG